MSTLSTTNLDQFKFHKRNRKVNKSQVKKLAASIEKNGQLVPIIVGQNNVVLDGQHRLNAIKLINKTAEKPMRIKYIRKSMSMTHVAEINAHQLQWRIVDWIHYYAEAGNENYLALQYAAEYYKPLKLSALAAFLNPGGHAHSSYLTSGEYVYEINPAKEYILDKLVALSKINAVFAQKSVLVAIMWLMRQENFDAQRLFHALERNFESVLVQSGTGNWARHMLYWYNKGLRHGRLNVNDLPRHH